MDQPAIVGYLVDAILATGFLSCLITVAIVAAVPIAVGYRTGNAIAIRWHARRIAHVAETYLRYPHLRPVIDHFDQPREETP